MKLTRCKNGHFFDEDKYKKCPHCQGAKVKDVSETAPINSNDSRPTAPLNAELPKTAPVESLQGLVNSAIANEPPASKDDQKTEGYFSKRMGVEPVVGWLVCIEGAHFGEDFRLKAGRNFIGRSSSMDVFLSGDGTVSRDRHAIILYEPRHNEYVIQPGDSKELFYLNDEVVLMPKTIKRNDILQIGETKLIFIPCCDENFNWNQIKKD
jgi:hypothetical protein